LLFVFNKGEREMKNRSIEERVIGVVREQLGTPEAIITRETSFIGDLGADSLDTAELVMELEEEFKLKIPDDEAEGILTVGQAVDYINSVSTNS